MNFKKMKKEELLAEAKKQGIKATNDNTKAEIIALLEKKEPKAKNPSEKPVKEKTSKKTPENKESEKTDKKEAKAEPKKKSAKSTNKRRTRKPSKKEQSEFNDRESMRQIKKAAQPEEDDLHPGELNVMQRVYRNPPKVWMVDPDDEYQGEDNRIGLELTQTLTDPNQHVTGVVKEALRASEISPGVKGLFIRVECTSKDDGSIQQVYIPSNYFFDDEYNTLDENKLRRYASLRIGSECDLNLYSKTEINGLYIAERQTAMRKQRCNVWYGKNEKDDYLFQTGSKVQARVVAASKTFIQVEVAGAETFITDKEISWNYVNDCRDICNVGDKIFILIRSVERAKEPLRLDDRRDFTFPVKFIASKKRLEEDPREIYFDHYHLGSQIQATVTSIEEGKNKNVIFCNDGRYDLYCNMRAGVGLIPHKGDTVIVNITGKDEKTRNVWGEIVHVKKNKTQQGTAVTIYR